LHFGTKEALKISTTMSTNDDRLGHLLTYTVFHIGVYISLFTALIGIGIFKDVDHPLLRISTGCFLMAGICGAIVASHIPSHAEFASYEAARLGPWKLKMLPYSTWAGIEHLAFWLGILPIAVGFLICGSSLFKPEVPEKTVPRPEMRREATPAHPGWASGGAGRSRSM
jgi:hypothetical protein